MRGEFRHFVLCGLGVIVATFMAPLLRGSAQTPSGAPWFGVSLPPGLGDPHQTVVSTATIKAPEPRVPSGEEQRAELTGPRIRRDLETIVGFSKASHAAGNRLWGRIAGFSSQSETARWAADEFRAAGLRDAQVQEFSASAPMWWSRAWEVRLLGHPRLGRASNDVVLESAVPTSGSEIAGGSLTASLVDVGATTEALSPVDVSGRIAVQSLRPQSGAYSERGRTVDRARELMKRGAVAVLNAIEQPGNMHVRDFSNCGIPCFNLGGADSAFVHTVIERAAGTGALDDLRVRLTLQSETLAGLKAQNAMASVPGVTDEVIVVNAHTDGWFDAAGDNGDGLAVLIALARHFVKAEHKPQRTLVFVASAGHHGTGLNGPGNFVRMNPRVGEKTVLVVNLEHVAQLRVMPSPWRVDPTEQPMSFGISNLAPALIDLGQRAMARYGFNLNPKFSSSIAGDLGGYAPLGVARLQAIHSGPLYHTSGDVLATISEAGLERAARFYAYFIAEAAKLDRAAINPEGSKPK
jgi:hypothetical protein